MRKELTAEGKVSRVEVDRLGLGDYLALFDVQGHCGFYSDSELHAVRGWLAARDLTLVADDVGLRVDRLPS